MLNYDVYEAFRSAGADEEKALAQDQALFATIESKFNLHSWMIGAVLAMNIAILVRLMVPG